jgi:hypothetical protein
MHEHGRHRRDDGTSFGAAFEVGGLTLHMHVSRHGSALAAVWGAGPAVAASVLLPGREPADDAAALRALQRHAPRLAIEPADYEAIAALRRPCLGTFYLDARRYDDSSVELLATALALATLFGPEGTLTTRERARPETLQKPPQVPRPAGPFLSSPAATHPAAPMGNGNRPKLHLAPDQLRRVMELVSKKSSAAIERRAGTHFRVYPPSEYLARPDVLRGHAIFDELKDTSWSVRWYDGREDRLSFGEFLGFVDQIVECERAYEGAVLGAPRDTARDDPGDNGRGVAKNANVWQTAAPTGEKRQVIRVKGAVDIRKLVADPTIRSLFDVVALEMTPGD